MIFSLPVDAEIVASICDRARYDGIKIVTTNGVFDILHYGHLALLKYCAHKGDLLVVGINSNESVRRLGKGDNRPIQDSGHRAALVAGLKCVVMVVIFPEPDPCAFLEIVAPHIHVKGGDYDIESMPETEVVRKHGGVVKLFPLIKGLSTSSIIDRIRGEEATDV